MQKLEVSTSQLTLLMLASMVFLVLIQVLMVTMHGMKSLMVHRWMLVHLVVVIEEFLIVMVRMNLKERDMICGE